MRMKTEKRRRSSESAMKQQQRRRLILSSRWLRLHGCRVLPFSLSLPCDLLRGGMVWVGGSELQSGLGFQQPPPTVVVLLSRYRF